MNKWTAKFANKSYLVMRQNFEIRIIDISPIDDLWLLLLTWTNMD